MAEITLKTTAIHEAGHAVAHKRLGIEQDFATIEPRGRTLGGVKAEGVHDVCNAGQARPQVLAYCAGYAALVAAGYTEAEATLGADDDFDNVNYLIESWLLNPSLEDWKAEAVLLMREPRNLSAVQVIARELLDKKRLDGDLLTVYLEFADGEATQADLDSYLLMRSQADPRRSFK